MDIKVTDKRDNQKKVDTEGIEKNDDDLFFDIYCVSWIIIMVLIVIPFCLWMYFNPR